VMHDREKVLDDSASLVNRSDCFCRFHGGLSTGPRTAEGKARIAEAQRRRWAMVRRRSKKQRKSSKTP
jgi:hypothetical protein